MMHLADHMFGLHIHEGLLLEFLWNDLRAYTAAFGERVAHATKRHSQARILVDGALKRAQPAKHVLYLKLLMVHVYMLYIYMVPNTTWPGHAAWSSGHGGFGRVTFRPGALPIAVLPETWSSRNG